MSRDETPAIIIAVAFILLVAFLFWVTMDQMDNADDFLKVWAAVGPIVGVVTGLIPTYFFRGAAKSAELRAETHAAERGKMEGALRARGLDPEELLKGSTRVQGVPPPA